jgi:DNA-binding winged helix-turn-helix (wHTH) protein
VLKLQRVPLEALAALIEQKGQIVSPDQLAERIWGKGVSLDADNSLNVAIRKLRQALGDNPEEPHFIQTISGQGYRLIAPVVGSVVDIGVEPDLQPQPIAADACRSPIRKSYRRSGAGLLQRRPHRRDDYPGVIGRTSVMYYKHRQQPLLQLGHDLGVQYVLEGSVRRNQEDARISVRLLRVADGATLWTDSFDRSIGDVLALQSEIAQRIGGKLLIQVLGRATNKPTRPEVVEAYLRGRFELNRLDTREAAQGYFVAHHCAGSFLCSRLCRFG